MAKAKKPNGQRETRPRENQDALRTEARARVQDMPAETAGGRLDDSADEWAQRQSRPAMGTTTGQTKNTTTGQIKNRKPKR